MNPPIPTALPQLTPTTARGGALRVLEQSVEGLLPLPGLTAEQYARGHALFEARSDQRGLMTAWLCALLAARPEGPTRVLSIGCGDGSVDVEVARTLAWTGQPVDYAGIEPNAAVADRCLTRLSAVAGVRAVVDQRALADSPLVEGRYDVVLAVHSLYYVPDLADALRTARRALAPGGVLVVLHAPRQQLNQLVDVLAPDQHQPFSAAVARALSDAGDPVLRLRLEATLDLTPSDEHLDTAVLDFAVQVRLPVFLRGLVLNVLAEAALPSPGLRVPHPVDAFVVSGPVADSETRKLVQRVQRGAPSSARRGDHDMAIDTEQRPPCRCRQRPSPWLPLHRTAG